MSTTNVLVMVHGMVTDIEPKDHTDDYEALWAALTDAEPTLQAAIAKRIWVEWGHESPHIADADLRDDQLLTRAENTIHNKVSYAEVKGDQSPQNHTLGFELPRAENFITVPIKETALLLGVTDAFYYAAPDGEDAVRFALYTQVLDQLQDFRSHPEVRLHVIAHSLGVTVAHDFLFGLFAPDSELTGGVPGFFDNSKATPQDKDNYAFWRGRAQDNSFVLGSMSSTAGQLPLMVMRKQKMVNTLAQGSTLDPTVIGVPLSGGVKWRMFYTVNDILGFPARRLYQETTAIEEYEANTNLRPDQAHSGYWTNDAVIGKIANLLAINV